MTVRKSEQDVVNNKNLNKEKNGERRYGQDYTINGSGNHAIQKKYGENVKYGEYHVKHHPYTTSRRTDNCIY